MSTDDRLGTLPTRRAVRAATEPVRLSLYARIHRQTVSTLYVVRLCTALLSQSVVIVLSCTARYYSVHRVVTQRATVEPVRLSMYAGIPSLLYVVRCFTL